MLDEEELGECGKIVEVLVVKASDVAKLLSKPPEGDEVSLRFGKIFEEEYALANHVYRWAWYAQISKWFIRKVAARLRAEGIYKRDLILKAYRAYAALLKAGVVGEKPRTRFKELTNSLFVAAQPDLYDETTDTYYEFKLYPINEYARKQAEVFAWVLGKPVVLVGLREDPGGYVSVEKEVINPPKDLEVDVNELRKVAVAEDFCSDLMIPVHQYDKYFTEEYYDIYEE
ncbi:MAG: hypothetical protein LM561_01685 [Desulfurococcaceae archaeon]|nr:hypothetical protein [Desulfurococcaceae archaeon]